MGELKIRNATLGDEQAIAKVHVESWRSTYSGIVPQAYLNELSIEKRTLLWNSLITPLRENGQTIVAGNNIEIIGFVDVGISRTPELPTLGEINAIYLLKDFQTLGIGKKLFIEGVNWLTSKGFSSMFLWVIKDNPTKFFYEHMGGKVFSSKIVTIGGKDIEEVSVIWKDITNFNYRALGFK